METAMIPGEYMLAADDVIANEGRPTAELRVVNTGDRAVQVGSHFHFFEVNRALSFEREKAFGMRLNIPSGTAVRFEPGDDRVVKLVQIGGNAFIHGFNSLTNGLANEATKPEALRRARESGFMGTLR
jgi:urease beta subunit